MTTEPDSDQLSDAMSAVVGRLDDVVRAVSRVVPDVQRDWPDAAGQAWVARAELVGRSLVRELDAAQELIRAVTRSAPTLSAPTLPASSMDGPEPEHGAAHPAVAGIGGRSAPRREGGPRLAGTEADREDDDRGVRIAELPPG